MRYIYIFLFAGLINSGKLIAQSNQVQWKDLIGVSQSNGALTRTLPQVAWNAGGNSYNQLAANMDGWVEFTVGSLSTQSIVGFSYSSIDVNYPTVLYGWFLYNNQGSFMELGNYVTLATVTTGDVLRAHREGSTIKYFQNGVLRRTVKAFISKEWAVKGLIASGSTPAIRSSFDSPLVITGTINPLLENGTGGGVQLTVLNGVSPYSYLWSTGETTSNISNKSFGDYAVTVTDSKGKKARGNYRIKQQAQVIYVKKGAAGAGNGTSWVNAYTDLQLAIAATTSISGRKEIWVAQGEYKPTTTVDRSISFVLPSQTFLYGGFVGNETSFDSRDWKANRTVLSGDLGKLFDKNDNSYNVVVAKNIGKDSGIDGFVVTQGNNSIASPSSSYSSGGGMLVVGTTSTTEPRISNCQFVNNTAGLLGGGLANISDGSQVSTEVTNCFFNDNTSPVGGAVGNNSGTYNVSELNTSTFVNCIFSTNHSSLGGAIGNNGGHVSIISCTFTKNNSNTDGGAIYNAEGSTTIVKNSILWENFKGTSESAANYNQIANVNSTPIIQHNIVQGGYGVAADMNTNEDPLFVREPSVVGKFPRTSVIPIATTDLKYENNLNFSGPRLPGNGVYWTYYDQPYQKLYLCGKNFQVIDFANLTNGLPTSTVHLDFDFGRIQRPEKSIYTLGNKIYVATARQGLFSIDRSSGTVSLTDLLIGEPITKIECKVQDIIIDNQNNLLYAPVFYTEDLLYGLLELNLVTNTKRWITTTSSPVALAPVNPVGNDDYYWNGHRLFHDEVLNILYYSMGNGVWWWNRNTNATGVINTNGGIPLAVNNPKLPSNLVTSMYIDRAENKFYFGTHAGLFVWNRNNNTSKVYTTENSLLNRNIVNTIDKNIQENLIYVGCEQSGGLFVINTVNGEQRLYAKDIGNETYPQMIDNEVESAFFDESEKKLYVSSDWPNGGVWVKDYNNLIPDYGDLSLQSGSPAIDKGDQTVMPTSITLDLNKSNRYSDYASISGSNSLDLGAYEKELLCPQLTSDFSFVKSNRTFTFTPNFSQAVEGCQVTYNWDFGDGTTSELASPSHSFAFVETYNVSLRVTIKCGECPSSQIQVMHPITIEPLCESIHCDENGGVSIGTPISALGYRFSVNGKVITTGAKVALKSRWPDYVFSADYKLMSLPQLKNYISVNKHLPSIPTAEDVKQKGIDTSEMSIQILSKVEELTLHLILLNDRLDKLEKVKHKSTSKQ